MLEPVGPLVFLGYGDYRGNTGPIELISFDTVDKQFMTDGPLATEEIVDLRVWAGRLWIPNIDPIAHAGEGSVFVTSHDCSGWHELPPIPDGVHIFDAQVHADEMLLATGSLIGAPAKIIAVGENEAFRDVRQMPARPNAFLRYEHIESLGRGLLLSARIFATQTHSQLELHNGQAWQVFPGPPSAGTLIPVARNDEPMVAVCLAEFDGDPGKSGLHLRSWLFDGRSLSPHRLAPPGHRLLNWYRHHRATKRYVWALSQGPQGAYWLLGASESKLCPGNWSSITQLPRALQAANALLQGAPSALTWHGNVLYIGTTQGQLWSIAMQHHP